MLNGKKPVTLDVFLLVRDHFNISSEYLLGEEEIKLSADAIQIAQRFDSHTPERRIDLARMIDDDMSTLKSIEDRIRLEIKNERKT